MAPLKLYSPDPEKLYLSNVSTMSISSSKEREFQKVSLEIKSPFIKGVNKWL